MNYRMTYYPDLDVRCYLNHAAIAPLSRRIRKAFEGHIANYAAGGARGWTPALEAKEAARNAIAALIGGNARQIGLVNNTSMGLTFVAREFPWERGDGLVLVRGEFPGNVLPWLAAARDFGLRVQWLDFPDLLHGSRELERVMALRPRLLAVSWVQYHNGNLLPLARLLELRARFGVQICLDAIQALGALRLNCADQIDYLVCGGHKWLLGCEGSGFVHILPERQAAMRPSLVSWLSQEDPVSFLFKGAGYVNYEKPFRSEPSRFELASTCNWLYSAMAESADMLLEVGLERVEDRVLALAERCRRGLAAMGARIEPAAKAGIASFPLPATALRETVKFLTEAGIQAATPDGYLRFAPHFYNEETDIDYCLEMLERALELGLLRLDGNGP